MVMPMAALGTALLGASGTGSNLVFDGVTITEQPELGVLTGTATLTSAGTWAVDPLDLHIPTLFVVRSGPCTVAQGGLCVGRWPGGYLPNERCTIAVAGGGGTLGMCPVFDVYGRTLPGDFLTIPDGRHYTGSTCPSGIVLAAGQTLTWQSDYRWQGNGGNGMPQNTEQDAGGGWQICFEH